MREGFLKVQCELRLHSALKQGVANVFFSESNEKEYFP